MDYPDSSGKCTLCKQSHIRYEPVLVWLEGDVHNLMGDVTFRRRAPPDMQCVLYPALPCERGGAVSARQYASFRPRPFYGGDRRSPPR